MIFGIKTVRRSVIVGLLLILMIGFIGSVSALSANLGNARMILRVKTGDIIEKTVLVKNINNETIDIEADVTGDIAKDITIKNPKFTLLAGEEKNIEFTIKVREEGTFENKINVKFISEATKRGVGLSSTVIVIAEKGTRIINNTIDDTIINDGTTLGNKLSTAMIAMITTIVLLVILAILYLFSKRKSRNKIEEEKKRSIKPKKETVKK